MSAETEGPIQEPFTVEPETVMPRIEEITRMLAALTHEISECCTLDDGGVIELIPNVEHVTRNVMLAQLHLARALAGPAEVEREGRLSLEILRDGEPDLYRVVMAFIATLATYPAGITTFGTCLPSRFVTPAEPTPAEARRLARVMRAVTRLPGSDTWSNLSAADCEDQENEKARAAGKVG